MLSTRVAQGRAKDVDRYVTPPRERRSGAAALTHRLLAFSRRQTLDPKPTDVNRLIEPGMQVLTKSFAVEALAMRIMGVIDGG